MQGEEYRLVCTHVLTGAVPALSGTTRPECIPSVPSARQTRESGAPEDARAPCHLVYIYATWHALYVTPAAKSYSPSHAPLIISSLSCPQQPNSSRTADQTSRNFTSPRKKSLSWFDSSSHSPHSLEPCHTFLILSNVRRQAEPSRPKVLPLSGSEQALHPNPSSPAHTPLCSVGRHRQRR